MSKGGEVNWRTVRRIGSDLFQIPHAVTRWERASLPLVCAGKAGRQALHAKRTEFIKLRPLRTEPRAAARRSNPRELALSRPSDSKRGAL